MFRFLSASSKRPLTVSLVRACCLKGEFKFAVVIRFKSTFDDNRTGWKDSILSLPKKWLSTAEDLDEFGFPCELPKLPLPPLEQTMDEYLRQLEAITTPAQMERTKSLVRQFQCRDGPGPELYEFLAQKRDREKNWAYNYWLNDMYMDVRLPLPINSNPGMVLPPRKFKTVKDMAYFGARILAYIMDYKNKLDTDQIQKERAGSREKNQPLCMEQYYRILGSCRQPGLQRDTQFLLADKCPDQHVVVICRNHMYLVIVKAFDRGILTEGEIASQLVHILSEAPGLPREADPIGLLTAEPRSEWAKDRNQLMLASRNRDNIRVIETALLVMCFDEPLDEKFNARSFVGATPALHYVGDRDETNMAHEMLHGGGSAYNSANRWFDKTIQIIICTDGTWGLCYEHSQSEGNAVILLLETFYKTLSESEEDCPLELQHHLPSPERLEWCVTAAINDRFKKAAISVDRAVDDFDFYVYRYKTYGTNFMKSAKCSPDVYIQLAMQLAYYKLYGHLCATYESASTRRFLLGRVDCIRAANKEALDWAKAMCQGEGANVPLESDAECDDDDERKVTFNIFDKDQLRDLFREAVKRQTEVMISNILGNGLDIPLLGYRESSREVFGKVHDLFLDESYKKAITFLLSTSQVSCETDSFMGYGPVTPRGYGCSYNPYKDEIVFCIAAFFSCPDTSTTRFAKSLTDSLNLMQNLLND